MALKTTETKKCKRCLKRTTLENGSCPFCGNTDFIFDGRFIQTGKPDRINIFEHFITFLMNFVK